MTKLNLPNPNIFEQLKYQPKIENASFLKKKPLVIVGAVGGSQLPIEIIKEYIFDPIIIMHRNYGLPKISKDLHDQYQSIAISYSGNSEEVIDFTKTCLEQKIPVSVITKGGELLEIAKQNNLPFVLLPESGLQPRDALGFIIRAFFALLKAEEYVKMDCFLTVDKTRQDYAIKKTETESLTIFKKLKNKIPVIYSSYPMESLSLVWKIRFNENVKIHSFRNIFPELNHNEMSGFGKKRYQRKMLKKMAFIFFKHNSNHKRNLERINLTEKIAKESSASEIIEINLPDTNDIFSALTYGIFLADCVSYRLANYYGVSPAPVEAIEKFKKLL